MALSQNRAPGAVAPDVTAFVGGSADGMAGRQGATDPASNRSQDTGGASDAILAEAWPVLLG